METVNGLKNLLMTDQGMMFLIVVGMAALVFYLLLPKKEGLEWLDSKPKKRGKAMRHERRKHVEYLATYEMVSRIEDLVATEQITRAEAKEVYLKLKRAFPIRDLFPSTEALKEGIKRRLLTKVHHPIPVPLPDLKPKEKLRHAFDKK